MFSVSVASKIKITESPVQPKATFLRKSAFLSTGDSSFKFDFTLAPDQVDKGNTEVKETATSQETQKSSNNSANPEKKFKFSFSDSSFRFDFSSADS